MKVTLTVELKPSTREGSTDDFTGYINECSVQYQGKPYTVSLISYINKSGKPNAFLVAKAGNKSSTVAKAE